LAESSVAQSIPLIPANSSGILSNSSSDMAHRVVPRSIQVSAEA
jgi:hypothetical protein